MSTDFVPSARETIKSTRFRSDLAASQRWQWVDRLDRVLLEGRLRRGLDYVDGAAELPDRRWRTVLPAVLRKLEQEQRLPAASFICATSPPRFVGGMTGRAGTGWMIRNLGQHIPKDYAVMTEVGLFNFAQFRAAPDEFFYLSGGTAAGRERYLSYFEDFLLKRAYDSKQVLVGGARGLRDLVPARAIREGVSALANRLAHVDDVEACYQAFGDFYCWLFNFHAVVSAGAPQWISKEPAYGRFAGELLRMVPSGRLVILVRDGRDVALSMVARGWHAELPTAVDRWRKFSEETLAVLQAAPAEAYMLVRYEDMVLDYERTIRAVLSFYDLPAPAALVHDGKIGPLLGSVGRWQTQMSDADKAYFAETCGPLAATLGYA